MPLKLGVVMDPISSIHYKKDSTLAMLLEAQTRGWELYYFELKDVFLRDGLPFGDARELNVFADENNWYALKNKKQLALADCDIILMRKDPPFNAEYIYATYILEHAERLGVCVVNRPQSLRDANEKLFVANFTQCTPPTLVTQSIEKLYAFWREHKDIVCKPLNSMGGTSVFRLREDDVNATVVFEMLTRNQTLYIMAQGFIPEIKSGDKRILMINGQPVPYALARVPQGNDWRGNLAVGAKGVVQPLSERDRWVCGQIGAELHARGLYFVGIDVIGDYLTEINVTSPTGIREIDAGANINVSAMLMDAVLTCIKK
jgi:glutathione synthase